jgi:hypothetical protein
VFCRGRFSGKWRISGDTFLGAAKVWRPDTAVRPLMKTVKTKLRHYRKSKTKSHPAEPIPQDSAEFWEMDHDHPDPDLQLFSLERSPKQENL